MTDMWPMHPVMTNVLAISNSPMPPCEPRRCAAARLSSSLVRVVQAVVSPVEQTSCRRSKTQQSNNNNDDNDDNNGNDDDDDDDNKEESNIL